MSEKNSSQQGSPEPLTAEEILEEIQQRSPEQLYLGRAEMAALAPILDQIVDPDTQHPVIHKVDADQHFGIGYALHPQKTKDEWLTPPSIIEALGGSKNFDLDPCSPVDRPWPTATNHFHIESKSPTGEGGLHQPWAGRVWLNPPYGLQTGRWLKKLAEHGTGIALVFARTDTAAWHDHIWPRASAILFLKSRIKFHHVDGSVSGKSAPAPAVLIAYGAEEANILLNSGLEGKGVSFNHDKGTHKKFPTAS